MELQHKYTTYVNAFYAVQEALDARLREHAPEPDGLGAFCRRANPFLWDEEASADRSVYEGFSREFRERFDSDFSTADEAYDFVRAWLASIQGGEFGTLLLDAFDSVASRDGFVSSFDAVREQINLRKVVNELMPQDRPPEPEEAPTVPRSGPRLAGLGDIPEVASLLEPEDPARRASIAGYLRDQLSSSSLLQWLYLEGGEPVATAGLIPVSLPPQGGDATRSVGLLVLCGGSDDGLDALLGDIRSECPDWEIQEGGLLA